jgi:hypothetical protein
MNENIEIIDIDDGFDELTGSHELSNIDGFSNGLFSFNT